MCTYPSTKYAHYIIPYAQMHTYRSTATNKVRVHIKGLHPFSNIF